MILQEGLQKRLTSGREAWQDDAPDGKVEEWAANDNVRLWKVGCE